MERQFAAMGLKASRLNATYGKAAIENNPERFTDLNLSSGEIGCALSHIKAWEEIVAGNEPYVAVFEDDIRFSSEAGVFLSDFSWISNDVHLVKLDTSDPPVLVNSKRSLASSNRMLLKCLTGLSGAAGYIISQKCAAAFLRRKEHFLKPIDIAMYDPDVTSDLRETPWQLCPAICVQQCRDETTDFLLKDVSIIDQTRVSFRKNRAKKRANLANLKRKLRRPLRRVKRTKNLIHQRVLTFLTNAEWVKIRFED